MKQELLQTIYATISTLNTVSVSGKQNLTNLSGSIVLLENVCAKLEQATIIENNADNADIEK